MNRIMCTVSNIAKHEVDCGLHKVTADFTYFNKTEIKETKWLTEDDYNSVVSHGYYLM